MYIFKLNSELRSVRIMVERGSLVKSRPVSHQRRDKMGLHCDQLVRIFLTPFSPLQPSLISEMESVWNERLRLKNIC